MRNVVREPETSSEEKKSGVGGTSTAVTLSWDHGRRMRDQGAALQCSLFLRVPMALPVCYTGRHLSNWLYCYVGIYLLLTECVSCAVWIWCHVFEANISEWWENEREANSGPVLPWKGMLLSPVAVKDHEPLGMKGIMERQELSFREKLLRWSELVKLWKIVQKKMYILNGKHFLISLSTTNRNILFKNTPPLPSINTREAVVCS